LVNQEFERILRKKRRVKLLGIFPFNDLSFTKPGACLNVPVLAF
jgi:hypothetical protein